MLNSHISESLEGLERRIEVWKVALKPKGLRVNLKTKLMISCENARKVTEEGKFTCAVCRKGLGSNSIKHSWNDHFW